MRCYLFMILLSLSSVVTAQESAEEAFARLPADLQALLRGMPPAEALRKVAYARQNLIATGIPNPTPERLRDVVQFIVSPYGVVSASAGATSFPPLSPLVPAISFEVR